MVTQGVFHLGDSKTVQHTGSLHGDFFISYSMVINDVEINIKLTHAPVSFHLLGTSNDSILTVKILDTTLFVNEVELSPSILLAKESIEP
jgi:hypothetical protein